MKAIKITYITLILCFISISLHSKDISVKATAGSNNYNRLDNAVKNAVAGDVIIVDVNVDFNNGNKAILINKGLTIRGAANPAGRYQLTRRTLNASRFNSGILIIRASNVTVENVNLVMYKGQGYKAIDVGIPADRTRIFRNLKFSNCDFRQRDIKDTARGLFFEGSFVNVLVENCTFNYWFSLVARDCPTLDGFKVTGCTFKWKPSNIS